MNNGEAATWASVSDKKPKGSRLIALNRASFDLIEIVGTGGFGPDIYYYHRCLLSSAGAAGETDVARNCNYARERGPQVVGTFIVEELDAYTASRCVCVYIPSGKPDAAFVFPRTPCYTYESCYSFRDQETLLLRPFYTNARNHVVQLANAISTNFAFTRCSFV